MKHVTLYSGGGGSWKAAKRVQAKLQPGDEHLLLFTDTLYEDADTYRFLIEGAANVFGLRLNWLPRIEDFPDYRVGADVPITEYRGNPAWRAHLADLREWAEAAIPGLIWIAEGRDPWEIFRDERFLGNSGVDPCSKIAKRRLRAAWLKATCTKADTIVYVGLGEHEKHRFDDGEGHGFGPLMAADGWTARAPLIDDPIDGMISPTLLMRSEGLRPARAYKKGYFHDNCGGFCCKAGQAHYEHRWRIDRDRFDYDAMMEGKIAAFLGADVSMLSDRAGDGVKKPLSLVEFARRLAANPQLHFDYEAGSSGCGCALDGEAA